MMMFQPHLESGINITLPDIYPPICYDLKHHLVIFIRPEFDKFSQIASNLDIQAFSAKYDQNAT